MDKFTKFCDNSEKCKAVRQNNPKCFYWNKVYFPEIDDFYQFFPNMEFEMDNNFTFIWTPKNYFYSDDNIFYYLPFEENEYFHLCIRFNNMSLEEERF